MSFSLAQLARSFAFVLVDIDVSKTDNDIFAYCPGSSLKQGAKLGYD